MSGFTDDVGTKALLSQPWGTAFDDAGALYIADYGSHVIRKYDPATAQVTTIAGEANVAGRDNGSALGAAHFESPGFLAADHNKLYILEAAGDTVRALDFATNSVSTVAGVIGMTGNVMDGQAGAGLFGQAMTLAADGLGNVYVTDDQTLRMIDATGTLSTVAGKVGVGGTHDDKGTQATFLRPVWVACARGAVYVFDAFTLRQFDPSTKIVKMVAGTPSSAVFFAGDLPQPVDGAAVFGLSRRAINRSGTEMSGRCRARRERSSSRFQLPLNRSGCHRQRRSPRPPE